MWGRCKCSAERAGGSSADWVAGTPFLSDVGQGLGSSSAGYFEEYDCELQISIHFAWMTTPNMIVVANGALSRLAIAGRIALAHLA